MKRTSSTLEDTLRVVGRKGTLVILDMLLSGPTRFTALEKVLKVSPRTLSERLKELEQQGIVHRRAYAEVPPRVEYTLTAKGIALKPLLEGISCWIEDFEHKPKKRNGVVVAAVPRSTDDLRRLDAGR
jgi:DNA-binding HxlR family transcriptional regulator